MNMGCADQTEKVIRHILEIIYLMTGEEYIIMKKPSLNKCFRQVSENLCQTRNSVLEIPADSPVHLRRSGCHPASYVTYGMPGEAQREFLESAFQPPPASAHVQIKCDDVAMHLSVEEWEYLEHHKEDYDVMIGKRQPCPDGSNGPSLQADYLSQMDLEQGTYNSNDILQETNSKDWNSENRFTAPKVSCIRACEINSSPKGESSDKIYGHKNVTAETWGSTQSRDVSTLQNNLPLNNEPLSGIFLETEIKEEQNHFECVMDDCENRAARIKNSDQVNSPSLDSSKNHISDILKKTCIHNAWSNQECILDGHQIKTLHVLDSSVESNSTLDFTPQPSLEKLQHIPILDDYQTKMAEFTDSALLDSHTLDQNQSPFVDTLQRKHIKKGLANNRCSVADQGTKTVEDGDFSQENGHTLNITNIFKDIPYITHTRTELTQHECSTDGHQTKTVDKEDCPLKKNTESSLNIFQNVSGKADTSGKPTNVACLIDETKKVELNDSLMEDSHAFHQLPNSFSDGPQRICIKTEPIDQEHTTNDHQKKTMDNKDSALVNSPILGSDTSPLKSHGKRKLTHQECSMGSQQIKTEEVHHSTPENNSSLSTALQSSNKPSTHVDDHHSIKEPKHLSKSSTSQSTGKVQPGGKPLKTITCNDCGKTFSCNSYLSRHKRLHTGEKPFICSECGKSFSWKSSLVTHKRTHFGEKPFTCKQCGKKFSDYSGIIKHRRIHTGEKPYSCIMCGEHFAQTYQLIKHQAFHLVEDVTEKSLKSQ